MSSNETLDDAAGKANAQKSSFARMSSAWETVKPNVTGAANSAIQYGKEWYEIEPGQASDVIRVSLRVVDLRDKPKYTALSYRWERDSVMKDLSEKYPTTLEGLGRLLDSLKRQVRTDSTECLSTDSIDDYLEDVLEELSDYSPSEKSEPGNKEAQKTVMCDGRRLDVGPNLYDALNQLRITPRGDYYWIDQICLLQDESDEKRAQIRIMGDIYRCAELVAIWLGPCPIYISPGIKSMLSTGIGSVLPWYHESAKSHQPESERKHVQIRNTLLLVSIYYLMTRGWFGRLWVLQEILLARETIFMLGQYQIDQSIVLAAINWNGGLKEGEDVMGGTDELRCHYENMAQYFTPHRTNEVLGDHSHMEGLHVDYGVMGNWFLIYYANFKYIPTVMLSPRGLFRQGYRWTLEQFLVACNSRNWGNPKDFVYGGLSLIAPASLKINQLIQTEEPAPPPLPPRPGHREGTIAQTPRSEIVPKVNRNGLWPSLDAHLDAEKPELFLNLAACLLSQPHKIGLLSVAALFRSPRSKQPTWIPSPDIIRYAVQEAFAMQSGTNFTACTELPLEPEISFDGTSLSLHAARLDTIEHKGPVLALMPAQDIVLDYIEFAVKLPQRDRFTGQPGLVAFANAAIGGVWTGKHSSPQEAAHGFCYFLGEIVRDIILPETKLEHENAQRGPFGSAWSSKYNHAGGQQPPSSEQITKIVQGYQKLTEEYPKLPWPSLQNRTSGKEEEVLGGRYSAAMSIAVMAGGRRPFISRAGCVGLGPRWLQQDDVVMLVPGFYVPYIFTSVDEHLRRKAERILRKLHHLQVGTGIVQTERSFKEPSQKYTESSNEEQVKLLQAKLEETQTRMGTQDSWLLVGEAYVGGIMRGEAIPKYREKFERISIV